jgi:hypothetical protein
LKIRQLLSDHFLMLLFCSVTPLHPISREQEIPGGLEAAADAAVRVRRPVCHYTPPCELPYERSPPESPALRFTEFQYQTHKSWTLSRRVIGKAEVLQDKDNPRFIVTNLPASILLGNNACRSGRDRLPRVKDFFALSRGRSSI